MFAIEGKGINTAQVCAAKWDAAKGRVSAYMAAGKANEARFFGNEESGADLWEMLQQLPQMIVVGARVINRNLVVDWRVEGDKLKVFTTNTVEVFEGKDKEAFIDGMFKE